MSKICTILGNFFFPLKCVFCGELLPLGTEKDKAICSHCEKKLPYCVSLPRCKSCGKPIEEPAKYCEVCRKHPKRPYVKICAPYLYETSVKGSIVRFKREKFQGYAGVYARHMQAVLRYDCPEVTFDAVVSVPPRRKRLYREGYDQAEHLARELATRLQTPYVSKALKQKENRQKQSALTAKERWRNAFGNFAVIKPKSIQGKTLLLVDDVSTTGATLYACSLALKQQGAAKVYCATAATTEKGI